MLESSFCFDVCRKVRALKSPLNFARFKFKVLMLVLSSPTILVSLAQLARYLSSWLYTNLSCLVVYASDY
jgi:hypothetical protein